MKFNNDHDLVDNLKYVFLDDIRNPKDVFSYTKNDIYLNVDWIIVRSYDEFIIEILENGIPYAISIDHDLADFYYPHQDENIPYNHFNEKTGYHCAKWLIEYCMDNELDLPKNIMIHSMNIVGVKNIKSLFESYYKSLNL